MSDAAGRTTRSESSNGGASGSRSSSLTLERRALHCSRAGGDEMPRLDRLMRLTSLDGCVRTVSGAVDASGALSAAAAALRSISSMFIAPSALRCDSTA